MAHPSRAPPRRRAYGHGVADVFLYTTPPAFVALVLALFVEEVALRTHSGLQQAAAGKEIAKSTVGPDDAEELPTGARRT
jgi:hypothetical protein